MKVGLLTGGGDCPGLNAVIRAVVQQISNAGGSCVGILEGLARDGSEYDHATCGRPDRRHHRAGGNHSGVIPHESVQEP